MIIFPETLRERQRRSRNRRVVAPANFCGAPKNRIPGTLRRGSHWRETRVRTLLHKFTEGKAGFAPMASADSRNLAPSPIVSKIMRALDSKVPSGPQRGRPCQLQKRAAGRRRALFRQTQCAGTGTLSSLETQRRNRSRLRLRGLVYYALVGQPILNPRSTENRGRRILRLARTVSLIVSEYSTRAADITSLILAALPDPRYRTASNGNVRRNRSRNMRPPRRRDWFFAPRRFPYQLG